MPFSRRSPPGLHMQINSWTPIRGSGCLARMCLQRKTSTLLVKHLEKVFFFVFVANGIVYVHVDWQLVRQQDNQSTQSHSKPYLSSWETIWSIWSQGRWVVRRWGRVQVEKYKWPTQKKVRDGFHNGVGEEQNSSIFVNFSLPLLFPCFLVRYL